MRMTACFFVKPLFLASRPTSKLLVRLLSQSRPGATSSLKFNPDRAGRSMFCRSRYEEMLSMSKFEKELSGSPSVRSHLFVSSSRQRVFEVSLSGISACPPRMPKSPPTKNQSRRFFATPFCFWGSKGAA